MVVFSCKNVDISLTFSVFAILFEEKYVHVYCIGVLL